MRKKLLILITKLLIASSFLLSTNVKAEEPVAPASEFTINYDNVSIIEYIQFISKICNANFIYNKEDLNFTVTVISKEPISKQSLMSTLTQILQIHNLNLIEDENNIIITKSTDVKELSPLVPPGQENPKNPIITRILPVKNTSIAALTSVIQPMISKNALLSILASERLLVVTDVSTNIQKISDLVASLDAQDNPLVIETYNYEANSSAKLISLAKQIMAPIISSNPYNLIPQDSARAIYVVSTPSLAKKTVEILKSLDIPPQAELKTEDTSKIFIYKPVNRTHQALENSLKTLAINLEKDGFHQNIINAIKTMTWMEDTHSFVFSTSESTISNLQQILSSFDSPKDAKELAEKGPSSYLLVKLNYANGDQIIEELETLATHLKDQNIQDPKLFDVLENLKWVKETNSILLSGDKDALNEVKTLVEQYDTPHKKGKIKGNFYIFTPHSTSLNDVENYLKNLSSNLNVSGLTDPELIDAINSMKVVTTTNSIIFTGNDETLDKIKNLLTTFDTPQAGQIKGNFLMYSPTHISIEDLESQIGEISNNLKSSGLADAALIDSLKNVKTMPSTNSLIFTGNDQTLQKVQSLLNTIDHPMSKQAIQKVGKINFWVYKIQQATPQQLITSIKSIATDLSKLDTSNKEFLRSLESLRYIKETNSLVFTGTQESLEKVEPLVKKFDIPSEVEAPSETSYFVYKPSYLPGPELEEILTHFVENLKSTNLDNAPLFQAVSSMKWSDKTKTLVFTGEVAAIEEIKQLLSTFDVPNNEFPATKEISGLEDLGFLVYKLQYHKGTEIQDALKQIAADLKQAQGEAANKFKLIKSIEAIQLIQVTNSLLCSGDKETLMKLKELINNLDVPLKQVFIEVLVIQTTLSNALSFGLEWGSKFQYKNQAVMGMSNTAPIDSANPASTFVNSMNSINTSNTPTGNNIQFGNGFDLGVIGDLLFHKGKSFLSLGSLLSAIQNDNEYSIIMTPKIIAQDGKTARIFNGQNIPYSGSVITNNSSNTVSTTNLEYRDVGMDLTITPILGNSDSITLTINLESSQTPATGSGTVQLGQVNGITTFKTTMNTAVHVANKNFLVLSGMVTDTKSRTKSGIPCLGGLPVIGAAFSKNDEQKTKNNIVIFLRPHIVNTYQEMQLLTQNQEDFFREQTGTPKLERDFDDGVELIKSYENE